MNIVGDEFQTNVVAIVQARLGSVRMPGKVVEPVLGKPLLEHLFDRLSRAKSVSQVVLAIPESPVNDSLQTLAAECGVHVSRGSELDVLDRFRHASTEFPASVYLRITADCPMIDPQVIDIVVQRLITEDLKYCSTGLSFPDGYDVEAFTSVALSSAAELARDNYDREHVTPWIQREFVGESRHVEFSEDLSRLRLTIDEPEDLRVISGIYGVFGHNRFGIAEVAALASAQPELFVANQHLVRNQGSMMGTGEKLWSRAKRVIPGGNMLLSKRPDRFLPSGWPSYFSRTAGCQVWDLDGQPYWDLGLMGVGTNILGYSHPAVDEAVKLAIERGNLSSLNAPEEVFLAERLCEMHPWASMARFTRSGGEAMAVAVRIARAASGRDKVAFCGYHGWHDWYLSANLALEGALDSHLLPGLETEGVPGYLRGSAIPFFYNDIAALRRILEEEEVGAIVMEVERNLPPAEGFLDEVRKLATNHSAVLVFDECTSGFRETFGGLHLKYGVNPDIAVFGKTLGNGYAINAVIGRREVMDSLNRSFVSSTFWTERIGYAAALAALDVMSAETAPQRVHDIGLKVRREWMSMASSFGLTATSSGLPALASYVLEGFDSEQVKTFVTGRMLREGYLATTALYASLPHTPEVLAAYFSALSGVFGEIAALGPEGLFEALGGEVSASGFGRLN